MRTQTFTVPPQEVLTRDSVTVTVDAVVYIRIIDPTSSVVQVENAQFSTRVLASTTIRNIFGTKSLHEILSQREVIANLMQELLDEVTHKWGVSVERVEIKDVSLPHQMQRVMASEAEATREARSKLIAAQGEEKASRCLKEAAQTLADTPTAVQLRYLQTLNTISAETDSTLIFPIPIDITSSLMLSDYKSDDKSNYDDIAKTINEIERDFSAEPTLKHLSSVYLNEAKKYF
ncbi:erythrocyte band 7 integral membrane -like [Brachionus plicatilis]|uniref:Erythrocyte band 7 integral membrane-like n=1 Tax=Brachionus plicatilis TaxID=10195 RepID=A0A3M7Q470_BRAPC|nr:erythrocyte band 7 integral membrane -like [Brachionus plicatilis]